MDGSTPAVIIDPGTDTLKAGFSADDKPAVVIPNLIAIKKEHDTQNLDSKKNDKSHHVGHEIKTKHGYLALKYPVEHGLITDFEVLEKIIDHTYRHMLKINSTDHPVLLTELPIQPRNVRDKLSQMMFEEFDVPGFYVQDTASLSLMHAGLLSGTVVESGDGATHTSVVLDGVVDRATIPKTFYAGRDVTYCLLDLLKKRGYEFHSVDKKYVRHIKETLCFISDDLNRDQSLASSGKFEQSYHLPSGEIVVVNEERFKCCEGLFHPERFGCDCPGIHLQVKRSLELADDDIRNLVGGNVVLAGGNTLFTGFKDRLQKELNELLLPESVVPKVTDLPIRKYAAWIGGAMMTSLDSMREKWITKEEYYEEGSYLVERKCT